MVYRRHVSPYGVSSLCTVPIIESDFSFKLFFYFFIQRKNKFSSFVVWSGVVHLPYENHIMLKSLVIDWFIQHITSMWPKENRYIKRFLPHVYLIIVRYEYRR